MKKKLLAAALLLACAGAAQADVVAVSQKAKDIQARAINLDTHLDTPELFHRPGWKITDRHSVAGDGSQVDYPRMLEGGLDGGFWAIYEGQGPRDADGNLYARDFGLRRLSEIREMVAANPDKFELATTPDDAARIKAAGKRIVFISMENAYPLEYDPSLLSFYFKQGLRMMSLVHMSNNDFADSATDPKGPEWHGLSDKGKALVLEANRLGIIIDQSHASNDEFDALIALSKAPIVCSHTASYAINPHPRNLDDKRIKVLAAHGGVIQVNSLSSYLVATPDNPDYKAEIGKLYASFGGRKNITPEQMKEALAQKQAIDDKYGVKRASFDDYIKHLLHIVKVAGWEHVGLGADWDGGGGDAGYEDITYLPKVVQALLDAGYNEKQVDGILGGNILRVMVQVQALADPDAVKAALDY